MLLTITATGPTATNLSFLLHKHPDRVQRFDLAVGTATVCYPQVEAQMCTAALLLEVDPVALVRRTNGPACDGAFSLAQYVNDRPYAASSMLSVAVARVFGTAVSGRCAAHPDLPGVPMPLRISLPAVPCRGGAAAAVGLFEPLGWTVEATAIELDPEVPAWGTSRYVSLTLTGTLRLADALTHLYVLLPVLDDAKHYWVGQDEVDKLLRAGSGWLAGHPRRELITRRYLRNRTVLVNAAVARLAESDDTEPEALDNAVAIADGDGVDAAAAAGPDARPIPLVRHRHDAVMAALRAAGVHRVVDLGCGDGALLRLLLAERTFTDILGVDVSPRALEIAARRINYDRLADSQRSRVRLIQSSVTYRDARLAGFDAIVLMEVIEHLDADRLPALEQTVFGAAQPTTVLVTTPNVEYNARYPQLAAGAYRHRDHRFEWDRATFADWAQRVAERYGYTVALTEIGMADPQVGAPTQMATFTRTSEQEDAA